MGRTKKLLVEEDWEHAWEKDLMYKLERQQEMYVNEIHDREPAEIIVVKKPRTKRKIKDEFTIDDISF